jgi:hypothetical protein
MAPGAIPCSLFWINAFSPHFLYCKDRSSVASRFLASAQLVMQVRQSRLFGSIPDDSKRVSLSSANHEGTRINTNRAKKMSKRPPSLRYSESLREQASAAGECVRMFIFRVKHPTPNVEYRKSNSARSSLFRYGCVARLPRHSKIAQRLNARSKIHNTVESRQGRQQSNGHRFLVRETVLL